MQAGDLVIFMDEGTYAKWFYGQMGVIESTGYGKDGKLYLRVAWLQPVNYHGKMTLESNFCSDKFRICNETREDE